MLKKKMKSPNLLWVVMLCIPSLLIPANSADAFSLGKIRVTGAFDESFKAEIPVRTDGAQGLYVEIGDRSDYKRIDVGRPEFLDGFRVVIADHPVVQGQKMIYISCDEPIYQPSFNLLLKARLGGGIIMENYFLALDFQKNLSLGLPEKQAEPEVRKKAPATKRQVTPEEEEELKLIADAMKAIRPGQGALTLPDEGARSKPATTVVDNRALLEQIRREEEAEVRKEQGLMAAAPAPQPKRPVRVIGSAEPAQETEPGLVKEIAMGSLPEEQPAPVVMAALPPSAPIAEETFHEAPVAAPVTVPSPPVDMSPVRAAAGGFMAHGKPATTFNPGVFDMESVKIVRVVPAERSKVMVEARELSAPSNTDRRFAATPPSPAATGRQVASYSPPSRRDAAVDTRPAYERPAISSSRGGIIRGSGSGKTYQVSRGDNLFKIVSELGYTGRGEKRAAVVALWLENKAKFIRDNMNGLNTGVKLDFGGLSKRIGELSRSEVDAIIGQQWATWTSTPNRFASASRKKPSQSAVISVRSKIMAALAQWGETYNNADMDAHLASYSPKFSSDGVTRNTLAQAKQKQGFGSRELEMNLGKTQITRQNGYMVASLATTGGVSPTLYFVEENGAYKIIKETGLAAPAPESPKPIAVAAKAPTKTIAPAPAAQYVSGSRPFVVHVASFKAREHSAEYVRLLRIKGYNAFEIVSDVPGKGKWRRVVVDRISHEGEAKALSQTIKSKSISDYTQVLRLPYAIRIGGPASEREARELLKLYEARGLAPYALRDEGGQGYNIFIGAYPSESVAKKDVAMLTKLDLHAKIVQP